MGILGAPASSSSLSSPHSPSSPRSPSCHPNPSFCRVPSAQLPTNQEGSLGLATMGDRDRKHKREKGKKRNKKKPPSGGVGRISTLLNTLEICSAPVQHTTKSVPLVGKLTPSHFASVFSKTECSKAFYRLYTFFSFFHPRSIRNN